MSITLYSHHRLPFLPAFELYVVSRSSAAAACVEMRGSQSSGWSPDHLSCLTSYFPVATAILLDCLYSRPSYPWTGSSTTSMSGSSANPTVFTSPHSHLDSLPYELQLHIASFLPARALTKTLARINGHWRALTDREVKRRVVQVLGEPIFARQEEEEETQATPSSSRTRAQSAGLASTSTSPTRRPRPSIQQEQKLTIFFEAQRPIDTVTKRHPLHFGHFGEFQGPCQHLDRGDGTSATASSLSLLKRATTCCFHFDDGVTGRSSTRGRSKGRSQASQTTSAGGEPGAATMARRRGVASEVLSRMREEHHTSSVEVSRSRSPPEDYQAIAAAVIASAGLPQEEGQRSRGALAGGGFATMFTSSVAADEDDEEDQQDDSTDAQEDIDRPLDAYDWAGPVSSLVADGNDDAAMTGEALTSARNWSDVAGSGRLDAPASVMISSSNTSTTAGPSHPKGERQKKRAPTYRMQLDPLDSFETWILTLTMSLSQPVYEPPTSYPSLGLSGIDIDGQEPTTHDSLQRKWEEEGAMDFSQGVRGKDGSWTVRTLRSEKRLAEGLDRIYRDWFQAPAPTMNDVKGKAKQQQQHGSLELNLGDGIQLPTAELLSTFGAVNLSLARPQSSASSLSSSMPSQRSLEIDSTNSTHLHLQPLPLPRASPSRDDSKGASNSPSSHDAFLFLASLPSHQRMAAHAATLSPPSSSSAPPSTPPWSSSNLDPYWRSATHEDFSSYNRRHRVEVQFEARRIEIVAAKWLAAWEEWREEEERMQAERGGGAEASQVIKAAGSSWDLPGNVRQGGRFGLPNANRLAQTRFL